MLKLSEKDDKLCKKGRTFNFPPRPKAVISSTTLPGSALTSCSYLQACSIVWNGQLCHTFLFHLRISTLHKTDKPVICLKLLV